MRHLAAMLAAVTVMVLAAGCSVIGHAAGQAPRPVPVATPAALSQSPGSYLGIYEAESPRSFAPVSAFAAAAGVQPDIAAYYSGWGEPFRASFARAAWARHAVVLVQLDPGSSSMSAVARGDSDVFLRRYADEVRSFGHPVILSVGHEMNGPWYPWGYHHAPASVFIAAWRHIVTLFRRQGARNVTWLWTVNRTRAPLTGPVRKWWPGSNYVTWVGIDGYYLQRGDSFLNVFAPTFVQVRRFTTKPVLLAETAVGPGAGKVRKIPDLFAGIRRFHLLGLVWFDVHQNDGLVHQNWRLEGNPAALATFRRVARSYSVFPRNVDTSP